MVACGSASATWVGEVTRLGHGEVSQPSARPLAQAVQVIALRLGLNLATDLPPIAASGLIEPLLGIAVLTRVLKIPGLMRVGAGGGNLVGSLISTATGVIVGTGANRLAVGALGAGRTATAAGVVRAPRPPAAAQYSLPMSVGTPSGDGSSQLSLPRSVAHSTSGKG